jgi:peptidyl-prolyl cis-trans isomerase D
LGLIDQILRSEIQNRILTREAYNLGIQVDDETVMKQIAELAAPLARDGQSKAEALQQVLRTQGISEAEFVNSIRQEMGNTLFRNAVFSGAKSISKEEAEALYQFRNEERVFEGFILSNDSVADIEEPTEENLQKYYEANRGEFAIPETRSITIATLKQEMLEDRIDITEDELREVYEDNIAAYEQPEKRKLQQAILNTQTDAQDVFKRVEKGASLEKAVKAVTGKESAYLGENDFRKEGLLEDIATPVFEGKKGDVIGPIQTALGWHVIKLVGIIEPQTESFESVKQKLRDEMLQDRLADDLIDTANMIDDRLASGEALETVVEEVGLTTEKIQSFNQAGTTMVGKDLFKAYEGDKAQILENAFDYDAGETSPIIELQDGRFITVRVDVVEPLEYTPFEEVKRTLEKRWIAEQKALTNRARAAEALNANKELKELAKEYKTSVKTYSKLKRVRDVKPPLTPQALNQIFETPQGSVVKLDIENGFMIGRVADVTLPDIKEAEKEIEEIQNETAQALPQEIFAQYINFLSDKYQVKVNNRVLEAVYGTEPAAN